MNKLHSQEIAFKESTVENTNVDFTRLLYMLYADMDSMTRQADTKAQIVLGVNAILAATIANTVPGFASAMFAANSSLFLRLGIVFTLLMIACLALSIFYALHTTAPRITAVKSDSLFFFGSINAISKDEYAKRFLDASLQDVKVNIINEIWVRSKIVENKFRGAQLSTNFLFAAIIMWAISRVLLAFT